MSASQQSTELNGQLSSHKILPLLTPFVRTGPSWRAAGDLRAHVADVVHHRPRHPDPDMSCHGEWRCRTRLRSCVLSLRPLSACQCVMTAADKVIPPKRENFATEPDKPRHPYLVTKDHPSHQNRNNRHHPRIERTRRRSGRGLHGERDQQHISSRPASSTNRLAANLSAELKEVSKLHRSGLSPLSSSGIKTRSPWDRSFFMPKGVRKAM